MGLSRINYIIFYLIKSLLPLWHPKRRLTRFCGADLFNWVSADLKFQIRRFELSTFYILLFDQDMLVAAANKMDRFDRV